MAQLTPSAIRSDIFAWYMLVGSAGSAGGMILCGWIVEELKSVSGWPETRAYRLIFGLYALLGIVKFILSLMLSDACELETEKPPHNSDVQLNTLEAEGLLSDDDNEQVESSRPELIGAPNVKKRSIWPQISPSSRNILIKLSFLFAFDSFASGLTPQSWITYFFTRKFSLPEGQLGTLFFVTNILAAGSNLVAASLAKRIGLIKTMVFTHLPSAILLALIPVPSNVILAMVFLALRASIQNMDQAPRQAFLSAVVLPNERTAVMGVLNVIKTLSQSGGPVATGWLASLNKFWIAFVVAGSLKAGYDLTMLKMFVGYKTQEDRAAQRREFQDEESSNR